MVEQVLENMSEQMSGKIAMPVSASRPAIALRHERWDRIGIFLSSLCAIHCLATPLVVLALPFLGDAFEQPWVHLMMAVFVVPVGLFAFVSGYRHHRQKAVFALGLLGLLFVAGASLAPHEWFAFSGGHDVVTIFGSILLLTSHFKNRRACNTCEAGHHHHHHSHH